MELSKEERGTGFKSANCAFNRCRDGALTFSKFCWQHNPDKEAYKQVVLKTLKQKKRPVGDLDISKADFSHVDFTRANLSGANLFDTNLSNADLVGADLSGSDLTGADLSGADLTKANLKGARLWHANLKRAKLVEADISGTDLWAADLYNARLWRADLSGAKSLSKNSFRYKINRYSISYRVHEGGFTAAEETYRSLKSYFMEEGRYNDASWASFKEKTMEKMRLKKEKELAYIPMAVMGALCGYGEKPLRIIFSSLFIILCYAALYYFLKSVSAAGDPMLNFGDYIYYSVVTFTTLGYGDIIPKVSTCYRLISVSEAFVGAFLMGLFIFTLARKYSAR